MRGNVYVYGLDGGDGLTGVFLSPNSSNTLNMYSFLPVNYISTHFFFLNHMHNQGSINLNLFPEVLSSGISILALWEPLSN